MKRFFILLIIFFLLMDSKALAFDGGDSPISISMDTIETILVQYSPDAFAAKNSLEKQQADYDELLRSIGKLQEQISGLDKSLPNAGSTALSLTMQLTNLYKNRDSMEYSLASEKIRYDQQIGQLVTSAQKQYLTYLALLKQEQIKKKDLDAFEISLEYFKLQLNEGLLSQREYESKVNQKNDLKRELDELSEQIATQLEKIRNILGIPVGTMLEISEISGFEPEKIAMIDYSTDLKQMLDESLTIKIKNIELKGLKNASVLNQLAIAGAENAVTQSINDAKAAFKSKYDSLMSSYSKLQDEKDELKEMQEDLKLLEIGLEYGFASKNQVENKQAQISNKLSQMCVSENGLYSLFIEYCRAKNGY